MTPLFRGLYLTTLLFYCATIQADDQWKGYINDKTFDDKSYGYFFSNNISTTSRKEKIRLICKAPDTFILYLPEGSSVRNKSAKVWLAVDSLPAIELTAHRTGNSLAISSADDDFWDLLAQMVAGTELQVTWPGVTPEFTYRLDGFTDAYTRFCGWIKASNRYHPHLELYR